MNHRDTAFLLKSMFSKKYWTKVNTIEFLAFTSKLAIIIPGLIFERQWWWLYIFALFSSLMLILTSTIKTLPTVIYFNIVWCFLAVAAITKHFI